jgi:hypothetical protein
MPQGLTRGCRDTDPRIEKSDLNSKASKLYSEGDDFG